MKQTVEDYETVKKEREITVCDCCGIDDDSGEKMIEVAINPQYIRSTDFNHHFHPNSRHTILGAETSASADVCRDCLLNLFGIEIDDSEIVEEEFHVERGELEITKEHKFTKSYVAASILILLLIIMVVLIMIHLIVFGGIEILTIIF